MGNRGKAIRLIVAGLGLSLLPALAAADEACRDDQITLRGDWGQARFTVELADDAPSRAKGLMNRDSLARSAGMLFVYPAPKRVGFWMKDTLIPLDMIFMDETGTVTRIHQNAQPHDLRPKMGGDAIQFVLEINGGMARQLGIAEGSQMRHPSVDPDLAAWPC